MLIDWFTVIAQVINFLILVWLLKCYLYRPIFNAIEAREKRIATGLAEAEAKKVEAQNERDEFQRKNAEFDGQRAALLSKATDEAKAERQRLLGEVRKEADDLRIRRQEALRIEQRSLNMEIIARTGQEVFAIARKALMDLAGAGLEERMVDVFVRRLRELGDEEKGKLASALKSESGPVSVRTAFDIPSTQRALIEDALRKIFGEETQARFETAPGVVSGIELGTEGHKVAWSIADYLASLEKNVGELLKEQTKPEINAGAAPKRV